MTAVKATERGAFEYRRTVSICVSWSVSCNGH